MEVLFLLVPLSLLGLGVAIWLFFRMNASGQFDDDQGPAWSILLDDDSARDRDPSNTSAPESPPLDGDRARGEAHRSRS